MSIIEWPHPALSPLIQSLRISNATRSAGQSITGFEQVENGINARWMLSMEFNNLKRGLVRPFRAMVAQMEGRSNVLRIPIMDQRFWPSDEEAGLTPALHSDGSDFSDGGDYVADDIDGVTATGTKGAKSIDVDFGAYGELLKAGQYFGILDELYISTQVEWNGSVATIQFKPGLAQTHVGNIFRVRPYLLARFATDEEGETAMERGIKTAPTLELVQVLPSELSAMENN